MYAQYGTVKLTVIDLTRFDRETVWTDDQTDLLTIRQTIGMTATYSPGGLPFLPSVTTLSRDTQAAIGLSGETDPTAATLVATPRGTNPGTTRAILPAPIMEGDAGLAFLPTRPEDQKTGPETDAELRARLWLPRQRFILWAYSRASARPIKWLESPRPGFTTDAGNGPKPLSVDVVSASGEPNSVVVHFQIQTETSPCPTGSDRLVLSHRWQMSHTHDENNYLTRVVDGQIVFNGAVMRLQGIRPDFVRAQFIHPVPIGFERKVPLVVQSSDGLTIRYQIRDTDPKIIFDPSDSGATMIQIVEKMLQSVETSIGPGNK